MKFGIYLPDHNPTEKLPVLFYLSGMFLFFVDGKLKQFLRFDMYGSQFYRKERFSAFRICEQNHCRQSGY